MKCYLQNVCVCVSATGIIIIVLTFCVVFLDELSVAMHYYVFRVGHFLMNEYAMPS